MGVTAHDEVVSFQKKRVHVVSYLDRAIVRLHHTVLTKIANGFFFGIHDSNSLSLYSCVAS